MHCRSQRHKEIYNTLEPGGVEMYENQGVKGADGRGTEIFGLLISKWRVLCILGGIFLPVRYDTIAEFNVDSKAEYTA